LVKEVVMKFSIREKFRLEIHWEKVSYDKEGEAILEGCYFNGPVLNEVQELNSEDFMDLDFGTQYIVFAPFYYIARISWSGVKHTPEKIYLNNVTLINRNINSVPKLSNDDYIVVDTEDHEDEKHERNLVYKSYLLRSDGQLYNFRS
jgi:hypothetical protein